MKATRAPEAEANLLAALTAAPALTGVSIDGRPVTDSNWAEQNLYLTETTFSGDWRGMGAGASRDDEFTITAVVIVRKVDTPAAVKARAWEIALAVGDVIYADTTLSGVLNEAADITGGTVTVYPATPDGDWQAEARITIRGLAVITP